MRVHTYTHTHTHTHTHIYIHTHAYIQSNELRSRQATTRAPLRGRRSTSIYIYTHTYIHNIHTYRAMNFDPDKPRQGLLSESDAAQIFENVLNGQGEQPRGMTKEQWARRAAIHRRTPDMFTSSLIQAQTQTQNTHRNDAKREMTDSNRDVAAAAAAQREHDTHVTDIDRRVDKDPPGVSNKTSDLTSGAVIHSKAGSAHSTDANSADHSRRRAWIQSWGGGSDVADLKGIGGGRHRPEYENRDCDHPESQNYDGPKIENREAASTDRDIRNRDLSDLRMALKEEFRVEKVREMGEDVSGDVVLTEAAHNNEVLDATVTDDGTEMVDATAIDGIETGKRGGKERALKLEDFEECVRRVGGVLRRQYDDVHGVRVCRK